MRKIAKEGYNKSEKRFQGPPRRGRGGKRGFGNRGGGGRLAHQYQHQHVSQVVPNSIKRKRVNYRLRKFVAPKSAVMILNEMVGAVNYRFVDTPPPLYESYAFAGHLQLFTAQCSIEGMTFQDTGPSKSIAKNLCAERAIQFVVSKKCADPDQQQHMAKMRRMQQQMMQQNVMTEEVPWAQLASLGLFKMFNDWQSKGWIMPPELRTGPEFQKDKTPAEGDFIGPVQPNQNSNSVRKPPENPTDRHPVQLLNEMRGNIPYNLVEQRGVHPNVVFVIAVTVDGREFRGEGKSKKDAKKAAALQCLRELHDISYPEEMELAEGETGEPAPPGDSGDNIPTLVYPYSAAH